MLFGGIRPTMISLLPAIHLASHNLYLLFLCPRLSACIYFYCRILPASPTHFVLRRACGRQAVTDRIVHRNDRCNHCLRSVRLAVGHIKFFSCFVQATSWTLQLFHQQLGSDRQPWKAQTAVARRFRLSIGDCVYLPVPREPAAPTTELLRTEESAYGWDRPVFGHLSSSTPRRRISNPQRDHQTKDPGEAACIRSHIGSR